WSQTKMASASSAMPNRASFTRMGKFLPRAHERTGQNTSGRLRQTDGLEHLAAFGFGFFHELAEFGAGLPHQAEAAIGHELAELIALVDFLHRCDQLRGGFLRHSLGTADATP